MNAGEHVRRLSVLSALLCQLCTMRAAEQPIFAAREFLLTRQFKLGSDVYPNPSGSPMAVHAGRLYLAGAFQIGARITRLSCGSTMPPAPNCGRSRLLLRRTSFRKLSLRTPVGVHRNSSGTESSRITASQARR